MFIGIANSIGQRFGGGGFDPDAQAFLSAAGITGSTEAAAVNTLVTDLKSSNIWSKMKALYPFVTDNRNLLGYTEAFENGAWIKVNASATANSILAPNGTLTADTYSTNTTNGAHVFVFPITLNSATYTYSIYAKKANSQYISIKSTTSSSSWSVINVDLDNTQVTKIQDSTVTGTTASVVDVGNGWKRISMTFTNSASDIAISYSNSSNPTFDSNRGDILIAGSGVADYYLWGAQLEIGSSATTYQPIATTQQSYISTQFKYNLVNPVDSDAAFRLVFNGGWTHSSTGATPNGTNGYADTYLIGNTHLAKGNGHLSYYSRTNSAPATAASTMGNNEGGRGRIVLRRSGDVCYIEGGTNGATSRTYSNTDSRCYAIANVISNQNVDFFRNGVKQTASAINTTNEGWSTQNMTIGSGWIQGLQYDDKQCAFASIGDGLTDTEASNLYTAVQAFQTSLSRQV